jgi:drug/metabolite transporter (DMT)-like permease
VRLGTLLLATLAMTAFATNSLLCRLALRTTTIDAGSFASIRIVAGALILVLLVGVRPATIGGNWRSALALAAYVVGFSFAYVALPAAPGALLLFGAVQATMIGYGIWAGERPGRWRIVGIGLAMAGLLALLLPGWSAAPSVAPAAMMLVAGVAWGAYSLRGAGGGDPTAATAGNFLRAVPIALAIPLVVPPVLPLDPLGVLYALLSGAVTSGLGYALWFAALRGLTAIGAATMQLSVPVLTALGAALTLDEPITSSFVACAALILGGTALAIRTR